MKTDNLYDSIHARLLDNPSILITFNLPLILLALAVGLGFSSASISAETENSHPNYRYISPVAEENKTGNINQDNTEKPTLAVKTAQLEPVEKPTDGKGALPKFAEADIDGDNYITKAELKNFPYMLQVFDKVDAGEDGKLEQHEYQNLIMETKREAEVR